MMTTNAPPAPLYYGIYRLDNVYGQVTPPLAEEIVALWCANRVLEEAEARRRSAEVVLTIRDADGILVGVNTVYVQDFIKTGNPYYFYRVFVRPKDSRSFGLARFAGKSARKFLRDYATTGDPKPRGVIIVVENRKLARPGARKMLARQGWTPLGKGPRGFDVWCERFDGLPDNLL